MKHARSFLIVAVAGLALLPSSASAGGRGHRGRVVVVASHGSIAVASPSLVIVRPGPRFLVAPTSIVAVSAPHRFFPRFGAPVIVTRRFSPLVVFVPPAVVAPPPVVYDQPPLVVTPSPLPTPTVIEYPTGWYQLRGDGMTTAYVWVWIPKPPPAPPSEAPPAAPPAAPSVPPDPPVPMGPPE